MEFSHEPVLFQETMDGLAIKEDGIYADGTIGGGGHAEGIAERLSENGKLIGIDRDEEAVRASAERLAKFGDRVLVRKGNYSEMAEILFECGISSVDGILLDLGVSSYQLDNPDRGFSYQKDAPLDMRMDLDNPLTAKDVVNSYSEEDLTRILCDYGEERYAKSIAAHIVAERKKQPILTTFALQEIVKESIPEKERKKKGHPAKKTFQAIRIEVNGELSALEDSIDGLIDLLKPGGRICIITFHSLEDRIVKTHFRTNENPCTCPPDFPVCVCGKVSKGRVITRKPITAGEEELSENSRASSAKLRIFEKAPEKMRAL